MSEKDFIQEWTAIVEEEKLKKFPDSYLTDQQTEEIKLTGKTLVLGPELFGTYEILDADGNFVLQAKDINFAKYILYSNRLKPLSILVPKDEKELADIVKSYEKDLDNIVIEIIKEYRKKFPASKKFFETSNQIFNNLNLQRY